MLQRDVAPGVHRVEDAYTNWYLIEEGDRLTVVDAGVGGSWSSFEAALRDLGRGRDAVEALVLTHGHFDHLGFAERARSELGVPVWVHEADARLTREPRAYGHERSRLPYFLTQVRAFPIVAALLVNRAWWPAPIAEVRTYSSDAGELPAPGRPRVVPTPGHTEGHCALHLPDRDTLIAGDAVVTLDPYRGTRGPRLVSGAATLDSARALASLDALAATSAGTVLTGHGEPWRGGAEAAAAEARAAGPS